MPRKRAGVTCGVVGGNATAPAWIPEHSAAQDPASEAPRRQENEDSVVQGCPRDRAEDRRRQWGEQESSDADQEGPVASNREVGAALRGCRGPRRLAAARARRAAG